MQLALARTLPTAKKPWTEVFDHYGTAVTSITQIYSDLIFNQKRQAMELW